MVCQRDIKIFYDLFLWLYQLSLWQQMKGRFFILILLTLFLALADLRWGSVYMSWKEFFYVSLRPHEESLGHVILWEYRIPKMLTAIFAGSGLALAGLLLQSLFRNPIVGPYVLGISSGAGLAVALLLALGAPAGLSEGNPYAVSVAAMAGAVAVLAFDLLLFKKLKKPEILLIAGLMVGAFSGAALSILAFGMPAASLQRYFFWTTGNLGNLSITELILLGSGVALAYMAAATRIKYLNLMLMGDEYLQAAGVNPSRLHAGIILLTGLLTGLITAFTGPLAFTGLIVPHLSRLILGSRSHQHLIPGVLITGAAFMLAVDLLSRLPGRPDVLPVNSITALIGAPLVIHLLIKNTR